MRRSQLLFLILTLSLAAQRLWELRRSKRHEEAMREVGGREYGLAQHRVMTAIHTGWFLAMLAEVLAFGRPYRPRLAAFAGLIFLIGQSLRYAAMRTLGSRWTTRVMTVPGAPPVNEGIYRYVRHPNYLGVMLELAAFPLLHSAYATALVFSLLNMVWMRARIRLEEQALAADSDYLRVFAGRPRFVPRRVEQ